MQTPLRIGTRGSQLALWQARAVATRLEARGVSAELVIIKTGGDRMQSAPLSEVGGKRSFVKEIEDALLAGDVDLAVHSAKDRKSTRLNSSHSQISYAVFCLKKKKKNHK